jgi:hypothetical protein
MMSPTVTRREVLRVGPAVAAGVGVIGSSGTAAAEHLDEQDAATTIAFEEDVLLRYRPLLRINHLDVEPDALYGWVARSGDHDTAVAVYWCEYPRQEGVSPFGGYLSDSHWGDHEPCYVAFDPATNEVEEVVASVYHWMQGRYPRDALEYYQDTRPKLAPVNPWHQYRPTSTAGQDVELRDLQGEFEEWLDNGLEEDLEPGTVVDPWRMLGVNGREHWWRASLVSVDAQVAELGITLSKAPGIDIAGAAESDIDAVGRYS